MKKTFLLFCFLIITNSQSQSLDKGTIKSKDYFAEISFEYVNGKIIIPVEIKKNTYRFILDTGAPNVLSKKLSKVISPNLDKSISVTDANNKKSDMGLISIPELNIGNIVFENASALVHQEEKNLFFDCFEVDGFIGSNLFRNSIIQIDTKNNILRITNDKNLLQFSKTNQLKVKLIGAQKSPYIPLRIGKEGIGEEWVLFDTGMSDFYDLSKKNYDIFKKHNIFTDLANSRGGDAIGMFGTESENLKYKCLVSEMKIGNIAFKNIQVTITNDDNSRIGNGILKYSIATLNFKDKKLYFDLYPEFIQKPFFDMSQMNRGISISSANNKIIVGIIWDETLKSKISVGNEITNINGVNYENESICKSIAGKSAMKYNQLNEIIIKNKFGDYIKLNL